MKHYSEARWPTCLRRYRLKVSCKFPFAWIIIWVKNIDIFCIEQTIKDTKRFKAEQWDETRYVDLKKARLEKENSQQPVAQQPDFMSDCIIRKSLVEREKEKAIKLKQRVAEQEIKNRGDTKGIVMAIDLS